MTYEEIIQTPGNRIEPKISYYYQPSPSSYIEVLRVIDVDDIKLVHPHFETNIIGTVMRGMEVELAVQLPTNKKIYVENKAIFGAYNATKDFGYFYVKNETYNADTKTYTYDMYDEMLKLMVDYVPINMTYPCTIDEYFLSFVSIHGFSTDILHLPNGSRIMNSDIYEDIGFTIRDVLEDIAQANGVLFKADGKTIKVCQKGTTAKVIDDDILQNQNISMGEHYGPINTIVLSRAGGTDNVYYPDPLPNNPIEFKIENNQLMNNDDRSDYLPALYNQLNGLEYDIYDCELTGFGGFEPLDKLQINTIENNTTKTYNSYAFNNDIQITQGYEESVYNKMPKLAATNFKYASATDKALTNAEIILNKQQAELLLKVSKNEIISAINLSPEAATISGNKISLAGKTIDLTSDLITIQSDNFSVDEDGNITANGGEIANITITPTGLKYVMKPGHNFTSTDVEKIANYLAGLGTLTPEELTLYDVNNDGEVDITDLVIVSRVVSIGVTNNNPLVFEIVHDPSNLENILQSGIKFYVEGGRTIFSANGYGVSIPQDVLFEDSQGNNGTIPLANVYSQGYMEVFGVDNNGKIGAYAKVPYPEDGEYFVVSVMESNGSNTYIRRTRYTMTNNTLVPSNYGYVRINGSTVTTATDQNYIYITKVVHSRW